MTDDPKDARSDASASVEEAEPSGDPEGEELEEGSGRPSNPSSEAAGGSASTVSPEEAEEQAAEDELESEMDVLQGELDALQDRHLRLAADFENYRRRAESEMRESWIRAQADLVRKLLDALDDLQRVSDLDAGSTTLEALLEGVELVERKLLQAMKGAGVEVIEPVGELFDPNTMEAVMRVPADEDEDEDRVAEVFQKGYAFKGHLVRPARVSVKKHG